MAIVVGIQTKTRAGPSKDGPAQDMVETTWTGPRLRSSADFASADRHSRRVRVLKLGLPLAALFIVGFFSAATIFADTGSPAPEAGPVSMSDGRIVMANPKLEGFTKDKRPYKLAAERAIQDSAKATSIELEKITADLPFGDNTTATMTAGTGVFDNAANKLQLTDDIELTTSDGMKAILSSARIDMVSQEMVTDQPVDIRMEGSHITADRMKVSDGGKVVTFESRVRLNIEPNKLKQAADDANSGASQ